MSSNFSSAFYSSVFLFLLPSIYPRVHEIFTIMTYRLEMLKEDGHQANITCREKYNVISCTPDG